MSNKVVIAAIGAIIAINVGTEAASAEPIKNKPEAMVPHLMKGMEKCFGISKAGKNDCASVNFTCAGQAKIDGDKTAWITVPKGTCEKVIGGTTSEPTQS